MDEDEDKIHSGDTNIIAEDKTGLQGDLAEKPISLSESSPSSGFPKPTEDIPSVVAEDSGGDKTKTIMIVGVIIFLIAIASAVAYYFLVLSKPIEEDISDTTPTPIATQNPTDVSSGFQVDERVVYSNEENSITFKYPRDVSLIESPDGEIIISKSGPTQKEGTELYDGISLTIVPQKLDDESLKDIVDAKFATLMASSIAPVKGDVEIYTANSTSGYKFTVDGVVEYDYIYLPLGLDYYVQIINSTSDPEGEGFQDVVDKIIDSIEFLPPANPE